MSNYWRLRCVTCGDDINTRWNHGDKAAKALAPLCRVIGRSLDALMAAMPDDLDVETDLKIAFEYLDLGWVRAHKDHDVRAADEYGRVFTLAGEFDPAVSTSYAVEWERDRGRLKQGQGTP